ncbi:Fido, protein-threonine AMPylation domain-containing protein [Fulvimarina manganoxydans]|uniref:protein adenylyltransferase n=1 Tax=Fulvimarina manganoxydans TaxID=937218 RepID=A0A1W2C0X3_9HYPH|nr:Fic family protein [Fulvimarina manganoxydans]MCK5934071.1 Fic family protein [Fulvimarina manganoxydans]SMC78833.1 Fido, protein-threonine AMPylation domain-containing protein [Fulvimarina manganoxydans]
MSDTLGDRDSYARPSGVLHNNFDSDDADFVRQREADLTAARIAELRMGRGPHPTFDRDHLSKLHRFIFQDVYPWAGHMRNERFSVGDVTYEPVEFLTKGTTTFLAQSRFDYGFAEAIKDVPGNGDLGNDRETFAKVAGKMFGELNYVHPFREGNGRTQRAFVEDIARASGIELDLRVITRTRMTDASTATVADPDAPDMVSILRDAADPARHYALAKAYDSLRTQGLNPQAYNVEVAAEGQKIAGQRFAGNAALTGIIVSQNHLIVAPSRDVPVPDLAGKVSFVSSTPLKEALKAEYNRSVTQDLTPEELARRFNPKDRSIAEGNDVLTRAHDALERAIKTIDHELGVDHPKRDAAVANAAEMIRDNIEHGRGHSRDLPDHAVAHATGRPINRGYGIAR